MPVLVVHGSGGGFDQGELLARAALGPDVRWIAPSRFGYLRPRPCPTLREHAVSAEIGHGQGHGLARFAGWHGSSRFFLAP